MPRSCTLADDTDCEGATNVECFACGEPTCKSCTQMVEWHNYGTKRVCKACIREEQVLA